MLEFSKNQKLLGKNAYKRVFDSAELKVSRKEFLLLIRKNNAEETKIGIIISKKKIRHAVDRNRYKRLVRESFRKKQTDLIGFDFVFLARNGLESLNNNEFYSQMNTQWNTVIKRFK